MLRGLKAPQLLYMNTEKKLDEIVEHVLAKHEGVFLVEAIHKKGAHEYIVDGDVLLGIYDIAGISREINKTADEALPDENYSLQVSSPGADSPLKMLRQYPKHTGREFKVSTTDDRTFNGKLIGVEGETLAFEISAGKKMSGKILPEIQNIPFKNIQKANIIISFK